VISGAGAFNHPAVRDWHRWLKEEWGPAPVPALVTPCSATKPYPKSPTSRKIRGVLRRLGLWDEGGAGLYGAPRGVEWAYLSDLLGLVPYARAHVYPACCYDVPPDLVIGNERLKSHLLSVLRPALQRLVATAPVTIVYLPRKHLGLFEEAIAGADGNLVYIKFDIFRGHRSIEKVLREHV